MDKISFIVPVYKVENYLSRCIESLLNQTHKNIEIILIDDASPDNSAEVMKKYAATDNRIIPIFGEQNGGVSLSRNKGLAAATGNWIAFCDGDDWYLPEFSEKMLQAAKENNADFVVCNYQLTYDNRAPLPVNCVGAIKNNPQKGNVIACGPTSSCCHLFRRELFEISGALYPIGIAHNEELPVVPVLAKYAANIAVVDEPLYCYYQRGGGSASNSASDFEAELVASLSLMRKALGNEYSQEAEYHTAYVLLYGEILHLCKKRTAASLIKAKIREYSALCPTIFENPYFESFGFIKRLFLKFSERRFILGLKLLSYAHSIIVR